ncbi:MAG: hypothetical protein Q4A29_06095 [Eubacteriales bacterium]|nr:hypothetical protein [Eubacteriales bacterium]
MYYLYSTINVLYDAIIRKYGEEWDKLEIDLPFIITEGQRWKNEFINILLVFDYERQDPRFEDSKIKRMQKYFNDMADRGKLYLNYPMVESYQDINLSESVDSQIKEVSRQEIENYKDSLRTNEVKQMIDFKDKFSRMLNSKLRNLTDDQLEAILCSSGNGELGQILNKIGLQDKNLQDNLQGYFSDQAFWKKGISYRRYVKEIFQKIILCNLYRLGYVAQKTFTELENPEKIEENKECFYSIKFTEVVEKQNNHWNQKEKVYVLNTGVLMIAEYNFSLLYKR